MIDVPARCLEIRRVILLELDKLCKLAGKDFLVECDSWVKVDGIEVKVAVEGTRTSDKWHRTYTGKIRVAIGHYDTRVRSFPEPKDGFDCPRLALEVLTEVEKRKKHLADLSIKHDAFTRAQELVDKAQGDFPEHISVRVEGCADQTYLLTLNGFSMAELEMVLQHLAQLPLGQESLAGDG